MPGWNISMPRAEYFDHSTPGLPSLIREAMDQKLIAIDTETTGLVTFKDIVLYWSISWPGRRITLNVSALPYFKEVFEDRDKTWILANAKYDMHMLANMGVSLAGKIADVCVMHALLYEDLPHGLKFIAKHVLDWRWTDFQDTFGKISKKDGVTPRMVIERAESQNFNLLVEYCANDAYGTFSAYEELKKQLEEAYTYSLFADVPPWNIITLWDLYSKIEMPYTKVLYKNERNGIKINRARLDEIEPLVLEQMARLDKEIAQDAGWIVNVNSTDHLRKLIFEQMGITPVKMTKGGKSGVRNPSTDKAVREKLAEDYPLIAKINRRKTLGTFHSSFLKKLKVLADPYDRIHTRFNQDVARCMPAGELVLTSRGYLEVQNVKVGDEVLTHKGRVRRVTDTSTHAPKPIYEVKLVGCSPLRTTGNHEFCCVNSWVRADHLREGDEVIIHSKLEVWASIRNWPAYEVSSWGRVRNQQTGNILTPQPKGKWGHLKVTLSRNGAQKRGRDKKDKAVHRLVLEAFRGSSKKEVRHINGISWDNTLENLCYGNSKENTEDARVHGTLMGAPKLTPEQVEEIRNTKSAGQPPSSTSKLNFEVAEVIRERFSGGEGRAELARAYGVSYVSIDNIIKDRTWTKPPKGTSATELGERYGVSPACIRDIWAGRRWSQELGETKATFYSSKVQYVRVLAPERTYGLTVEEDHSHVTGGIVTHNTGRLSSSEPNMQNVPTLENDIWELRKAFIPEQGNVIIAGDYSQLEMRLVAAASMEPDMIDVFLRGWDIHMGNASLMFGIPYEEIKEAKAIDKKVKMGELDDSAITDRVLECLQARAAAKNIGFGMNYGMGAKKLANDLGITVAEAKQKIEQYKKTYPAVSEFYQEAIAECEQKGFAFTVLGRRRSVAEITSNRGDVRSRAERIAVNTPIQGSAADVTKMAQIMCDKANLEERYGVYQLLQVHDEIVFEGPADTAEEARAEIRDWMEHSLPHDLAVPLTSSIGIGPSWGQAH